MESNIFNQRPEPKFFRFLKLEEKEHDEIYQMILQIYLGQKKGKNINSKNLIRGK